VALTSIPIRSEDPPPGGPVYEADRGGWYPPTPAPAETRTPTTQEQETMAR
jgi:hypothetical protein